MTDTEQLTAPAPEATNPTNFIEFSGDLDELYKAVIAHKGLSVVKYGLTICPPCQRLHAALPSLAAEFPDVMFYNVNLDERPSIEWKLWIFRIPQTYFYKGETNGEPTRLDNIHGFKLGEIKQMIKKYK